MELKEFFGDPYWGITAISLLVAILAVCVPQIVSIIQSALHNRSEKKRWTQGISHSDSILQFKLFFELYKEFNKQYTILYQDVFTFEEKTFDFTGFDEALGNLKLASRSAKTHDLLEKTRTTLYNLLQNRQVELLQAKITLGEPSYSKTEIQQYEEEVAFFKNDNPNADWVKNFAAFEKTKKDLDAALSEEYSSFFHDSLSCNATAIHRKSKKRKTS